MKKFLLFVAVLLVGFLWAMNTITERHAERRAELKYETVVYATYPSDEEIARAHAGEEYIFPDPCGLESVLCEGEEGWTE